MNVDVKDHDPARRHIHSLEIVEEDLSDELPSDWDPEIHLQPAHHG